jgi:hypothetical protein
MMVNVWNRPVKIILNDTYYLVLLNGLPISMQNKTLTLTPRDLLVLVKASHPLKKEDLKNIRDSVISHTRAFLSWIRFSKLDCDGLTGLYNDELNLKYNDTKTFLKELIDYSAKLRSLYHKTYKRGYVNTDPLLIKVDFIPFFYSFGAINFNNAIVSNIIQDPSFTKGNGYAYASQIPTLIGYPHWDRSMEIRGYHIAVFPSYTYNGSYNDYNSFSTIIRLAFKNGTQYLNLSLTAGLWWKNRGWINVTIKDIITNKTVFRVYKRGGGWENYYIPTNEIISQKNAKTTSMKKTVQTPNATISRATTAISTTSLTFSHAMTTPNTSTTTKKTSLTITNMSTQKETIKKITLKHKTAYISILTIILIIAISLIIGVSRRARS